MVDDLKPLTVPSQLHILPQSIKQQFLELHELLTGYIKSLDGYQVHHARLKEVITKSIEQLNEISDMIDEYDGISKDIDDLLAKIKKLHEEFINLETYHYQLLAANYSPTFLKSKYKKLVANLDLDSKDKLQNVLLNPNDFEDALEQFRALRKLYHLRREKLNRWEEERVTGFI